MKFTLMARTALMIAGLFGWKEIPIDGETKEFKLDAEQRQKVVDALGEKMTDEAINGINSEIKNMRDNNLDLKAIQDEIDALVKETNLSEQELRDAAKANDGDAGALANLQALTKKYKEQGEIINALMKESEGDSPLHIIRGNGNGNMAHSATHLFGSTKIYDAFEGGRSWNARLRDGGMKATDFNENGRIPLLQTDMDHFVNENSGVLNSLFNDFEDLPTQWDRRTGVLDRVSDGYIIGDEIVQGRAKGFNPKNNFKIASEMGQVFRKKIDITFDGFELQEMENTWIRNYNKEGSSPWKMSFIGFLLSELVKRQKLDDRNAQINGIFVQAPADVPGKAVNSQNGLLFLWYYFRDVKKQYRAFDIGVPTEANIVDYINQMIELIPEIERKEQGFEIELSSRWKTAYQKRAGELYPKLYNTDQGKMRYAEMYPIDYPNFMFQELRDMTKTDFIGIVKSNNVQILDYDVAEKTRFTLEHEKRNTHIFADYRLGIRFKFVGTKLEAGDPRAFEIQKVWSNNLPVFGSDVYAPAYDIDNSGILKITYPNIEIDEAWKTNVTSIEGATKGSIVKIKGNIGLVATKNLVNNSNLLLASDFNLASGGTIVLFVQEDGKLREISRTSDPAVATTTDVTFTTGVVDAKGGSVFRYGGNATQAISAVINGIEGKTIRIYGTDTVSVDVTLVNVATVNVAYSATLEHSYDFVQLTYVNGRWEETSRRITA